MPSSQDAPFERLHHFGLIVFDVVVTAQMEHAMGKQELDFLLEGGAELLGLPHRHIDGDDDVTQFEGDIHPIGHSHIVFEVVVETIAFEAEHIGRALLVAIGFVEIGDFPIIDEADGNLGVLGFFFPLQEETLNLFYR